MTTPADDLTAAPSPDLPRYDEGKLLSPRERLLRPDKQPVAQLTAIGAS